ncbi:TVP38/TMEM64 family protein [Acidobacteriota bacterium]
MTQDMQEPPELSVPEHKPSLLKPIALVTGIVVLMVLAKVFNLGDRVGELREWIQSLGALGPVVFMAIYVVAVVLAIPGLAITVMAGVLFGSVLGTAVVSVGSTVGASLAFLIARHIAREAVAQRFATNDKFVHLDQLTKKHGAIIVAITRLIPIFPFNLLNYGFGLTHVPFRTYVFWSWICMLPWTVFFVVGADAATSGISEGRIPWALIVVLAVMVCLIVFLVSRAKKKLREEEGREPNE